MLEVIVVVAPVTLQLAVIDVEDAVDELVEEVAVVGDHQDRPRIALEIIAEPLERFEVEVVRRLVEHQEVGLGDEEPREVGPHHPAAAHRPRFAVEVALAERQAAEDLFRFRLEHMAAELVEPRQRVVIGRFVALAPRLVEEDDPLDLPHLGRRRGRQLEDRLVADRRRLLGEEAEGPPPFEGDRPVIGEILPEDQGEKGRFPRPIRPDETDPLPLVDLEGDVLEKRPGAERFADLRKREHGSG